MNLSEQSYYPKKIKLAQLFFERYFIEGRSGRLPLNEFEFDSGNMCYVPVNMTKEREVTLSMKQFEQAARLGTVEEIHD